MSPFVELKTWFLKKQHLALHSTYKLNTQLKVYFVLGLFACFKIFNFFLRLNCSFLLQVIVLITKREDGGTMHVLIQISMEFGIVEDITAVDIRMVFTGLNSGGDHIH